MHLCKEIVFETFLLNIFEKIENNVSLHEFYLHQIEVVLWK